MKSTILVSVLISFSLGAMDKLEVLNKKFHTSAVLNINVKDWRPKEVGHLDRLVRRVAPDLGRFCLSRASDGTTTGIFSSVDKAVLPGSDTFDLPIIHVGNDFWLLPEVEQLGAIGHEIAHIKSRDVDERQKLVEELSSMAVVKLMPQCMSWLTDALITVMLADLCCEQEFNADEASALVSVDGMIQYLTRKKMTLFANTTWYQHLIHKYYSRVAHPSPDERIARLEKLRPSIEAARERDRQQLAQEID